MNPGAREVFLSETWPRAALDQVTLGHELNAHAERHRLWQRMLQVPQDDGIEACASSDGRGPMNKNSNNRVHQYPLLISNPDGTQSPRPGEVQIHHRGGGAPSAIPTHLYPVPLPNVQEVVPVNQYLAGSLPSLPPYERDPIIPPHSDLDFEEENEIVSYERRDFDTHELSPSEAFCHSWADGGRRGRIPMTSVRHLSNGPIHSPAACHSLKWPACIAPR